jgi:hypothetical protein
MFRKELTVIRRSDRFITACAIVCALVSGGVSTFGQESSGAAPQPAPQGAPAGPRLTPLKVQLVVARYAGEKRVSSLPYLLWVTANDRMTTNLRMGVDVPVSTTTGQEVIGGYSYRNIGTSIDCVATSADTGFNVIITLSDSSIQFESAEGSTAPKTKLANAPAFRTFTSKFSILLRDGQTAQYTTATDPLSGEVLKVDVTLNVLK